MGPMPRFHHANLGVSPGAVEEEAGFLVDVLGFTPASGEPPGAHWFDAGDGTQIHLSEDPDHRPAARAHIAIDVGAALPDVERKLGTTGRPYRAMDLQGGRIVFCQDPGGNRWELRDT
jgi:catechol 2,3-dioxygenase-like lactoylglutathione lyase family enzyme